jgi:hypothetical protein
LGKLTLDSEPTTTPATQEAQPSIKCEASDDELNEEAEATNARASGDEAGKDSNTSDADDVFSDEAVHEEAACSVAPLNDPMKTDNESLPASPRRKSAVGASNLAAARNEEEHDDWDNEPLALQAQRLKAHAQKSTKRRR